jgi:hypothetical protein
VQIESFKKAAETTSPLSISDKNVTDYIYQCQLKISQKLRQNRIHAQQSREEPAKSAAFLA